mmetsp:Transcript_22209/g.50261  ORF Transcript_22209/g.50261 Transcript_22209/m.50261 type:complete len:204 (-) Transcript_22209:211-822(-)
MLARVSFSRCCCFERFLLSTWKSRSSRYRALPIASRSAFSWSAISSRLSRSERAWRNLESSASRIRRSRSALLDACISILPSRSFRLSSAFWRSCSRPAIISEYSCITCTSFSRSWRRLRRLFSSCWSIPCLTWTISRFRSVAFWRSRSCSLRCLSSSALRNPLSWDRSRSCSSRCMRRCNSSCWSNMERFSSCFLRYASLSR